MKLDSQTPLARLYWELPYRNYATREQWKPGTTLSTYQSYLLIDEAVQLGALDLTFCDGPADPRSSDLNQLIRYATRRGLATTYAAPDARKLTRETLERLEHAGLTRLAVRLDAATRDIQETRSGSNGSFDAAILAIVIAKTLGLEVQIDTAFDRVNRGEFADIAALAAELDVDAWNISAMFGSPSTQLSAEEVEDLFLQMFRLSQEVRFVIQTTDLKHYRRFVRQQMKQIRKDTALEGELSPNFDLMEEEIARQRFSLFVNPNGMVWPDVNLHLPLGLAGPLQLQQILTKPLLQELRDPDSLKGKCHACEYHDMCGGSRARAYLATGDPFAEEPLCGYSPVRVRRFEA